MSELDAVRLPGPGHAIGVTTRLFIGQLVTRSRLLTLGALGLLVALLGLVARGQDDPVEVATGVIAGLGLAIVVPIATLVLASATIGEMRTEGTLVYLWLRPTPHWATGLSAMLATLSVALPLAIVPLGASAVLSGEWEVVLPAVAAAAVAVVGYTGVFVTLGALVDRAFLIGLGYILIWEGLIARFGAGFAKLSILSYAMSVIEQQVDVELSGGQGLAVSIVAPIAVLTVAVFATARILARREIA